jgi:hypothetical protein
MILKRLLILLLALLLGLLTAALRVYPVIAAEITVTDPDDTIDAGPCATLTLAHLPGPHGFTSLREAICVANNNAGPDVIRFSLPGTGTVTYALVVTASLPPLTDDGTTIDGFTQAGASPPGAGSPAVYRIILAEVFPGGPPMNGLEIYSSGNLVRGLVIARFQGNGLVISGAGATNNTIAGCHIGQYDSSIYTGNSGNGVFIENGASGNTIGGDEPAERCVIGGNHASGVRIDGLGSDDNRIMGSYIGTDKHGLEALPNWLVGVFITDGPNDNIIGGSLPGQGNLISANGNQGVGIRGEDTAYNIVSGNLIGTDISGQEPLGNGSNGILIDDHAFENYIGGSTPAQRNLISANGAYGVCLNGSIGEVSGNSVSGNYIGTDISGTRKLGNHFCGVRLGPGASNNYIRGGNLISGNDGSGVCLVGNPGISETSGNEVQGNYIGVDASGRLNLGNFPHGVVIENGAAANLIGGDTYEEANIIAGNANYGVMISGPGSDRNMLRGNLIGTGLGEAGDLGGFSFGVYILNGAKSNVIMEGVIAHSGHDGVAVDDLETSGNIVRSTRFYDNDLAIALLDGANGGILPPEITGVELEAGQAVIRGEACAGCAVQVYASSVGDGEGERYLGFSMTDTSGHFTYSCSYLPFPYLTATATDARGTSQFSDPYKTKLTWIYLPHLHKLD